MAKNKKQPFVDDGRTVANMNVPGMKGYTPHRDEKPLTKAEKMTRKERRAAVRGAMRAMLPGFLCILAGFTLTAMLLFLWVSC